jgi:branched-chain amino acid transport system ATP-binding protein
VSLLALEDVHAGYGPVTVLRGISFEVQEGSTVALLGANGAGKTTTLRAICGMLKPRGRIAFAGAEIAGRSTEHVVRRGIAHVPEGRGTFPTMTVEENLRLGAYVRKNGKDLQPDFDRCYELFPRLKERREQRAGSLSGGEQQMLAVARALMLRPKLLLLDEPSLGLAPLVTRELFKVLGRIREEEGLTMLVVEQNANLVLEFAESAHVLETGQIALSGDADHVRGDEKMRRAYLGY